MELLFEILFEVYGELMLLIAPERGHSKAVIIISKIIAVIMLLGVIVLAFWGIVLIGDYGNMLGLIPLGIAIAISTVQIALGIFFYKRNH